MSWLNPAASAAGDEGFGRGLPAQALGDDVQGIERARAAIASGAAKQKLEHFVATTRKLAPPPA